MTATITTKDYLRYRISPIWPDRWSHAAVVKTLLDFDERFKLSFELVEIGKSVEGRAILEARVGNGAKRVLLWSQMHGDEPTHTAVLMDLLKFLLTDPKHPVANSLLSECRLHLIVMLNPDGAERDTRRNAQDIDINRDARDLQTPEGRILWDAVRRVKPQFAFNLHNHNPRVTAGIKPKPAAVALLAPPIDQANTENETVRRAKQLVMTFANAVADECPGMVARYNADYMERAFGEAVQKSGAATMLIEVGGWSTLDATPLAEVHFLGLVRTLHAIASDEYLQADAKEYDSLPFSGGRELFDLMIKNARIVNGLGQPSFQADIGVNLIGYRGPEKGSRSGTISDLGDLSITVGKETIDSNGFNWYPGLLAFRPGITPTHMPDPLEVNKLHGNGVTTLIGSVNLGDIADVLEFAKLECGKRPLNIGFVGDGSNLKGRDRDGDRDLLLRAVGHGLLGVVKESLPDFLVELCQWLRVPIIERDDLFRYSETVKPKSVLDKPVDTHAMFRQLGLENRGAVRIGAIADLVLFPTAGGSGGLIPQPSHVLVCGNVVYQDGISRSLPVGQILRRA